MSELNLCEILKGHEGETFYCSLYGNIVLLNTDSPKIHFSYQLESGDKCADKVYYNGQYVANGEVVFFPSKDQRDWNIWDKEHNHITPKTWSDAIKQYKTKSNLVQINTDCLNGYSGKSPIEKSALALLKIHQLIEVGYGGNVTNEEWKVDDWKFGIEYNSDYEKFLIDSFIHYKKLIIFHTKKQAKEFLSYPENVQLLKDFYMV